MIIKVAIFPGLFDPINNGQLDIIKNASKIFGKLIVLLTKDIFNNALFAIEKRLQFVQSATRNFSNVEVDYWSGDLEKYVEMSHAVAIVRGLKSFTNFNKEIEFNIVNQYLNNNLIQTIFIMPNPKNFYINSSLVKKLCSLKKNLSSVVPKVVEEEIKKEVL